MQYSESELGLTRSTRRLLESIPERDKPSALELYQERQRHMKQKYFRARNTKRG